MTVHEIFLWSMPVLSLLMAVVAWFAIDGTRGHARTGAALFFTGIAIATVGALMAAYLILIEEGAMVGGIGALVSLAGLAVTVSQWFGHVQVLGSKAKSGPESQK
jgi:hypothetical protein